MTQREILDRKRFDEVTGGDRDLELELADLYLTTAQKYVSEMATILERRGDWSGPAHALKGASANLGMAQMQEFAKKAEYSEANAELLQEIEQGLQRIRHLFMEYHES